MIRVDLTEEERARLLWWVSKPIPPSPQKNLDVRLMRKLSAATDAPRGDTAHPPSCRCEGSGIVPGPTGVAVPCQEPATSPDHREEADRGV